MKITPPQALSRLATRFHERRARAAQGERPPLTQVDEDNLAAMIQILTALSGVLSEENGALAKGDLDHVAGLYDEKSDLLKRLELRQPVIEPFLQASAEVTDVLRPRIRALAEQLEENSRLLAAMAEAAQSIRSEVARVRDRHSLKGMYDKSGQTFEARGPNKRGVDSKL